MLAALSQNIPMLLAHYDRITTLYIKIYSAGNLRIGHDAEQLRSTVGLPTQDGIAQAVADGFKQYFWEGDLVVISDVAGQIAWEAPSYSFTINRKTIGVPNEDVCLEGETEGNLSTYR
jgi:hypothetical protein